MERGRFITLPLKNSNSTQLPTHTAITARARKPKMATPAMPAGSSAMITSSMMLRVVAGALVCGDALTVNSFFSSIISSPPL